MKLLTPVVIVLLGILLLVEPALAGSDKGVLRVRDGTRISFSQMIKEVRRSPIIFIGEIHTEMADHQLQLRVVQALHRRDRPLAVGLEMFSGERQAALDAWVAGTLAQEKFIPIYYEEWQVPWPLYGDIFTYAREKSIPLIGLNVPQEVAAKVAREGFASLTADERAGLPPEVTCTIDASYREFINEAFHMHGHAAALNETTFLHFCEAQMLWNKVMAWRLAAHLKRNPEQTVVVLTGAGHALKRGVPKAMEEYSPARGVVIMPEYPDLPRDKVTAEEVDYLVLR